MARKKNYVTSFMNNMEYGGTKYTTYLIYERREIASL